MTVSQCFSFDSVLLWSKALHTDSGHFVGHEAQLRVPGASVLKEPVETMTAISKPKQGLPNGLVRNSQVSNWALGLSRVGICSIAERTVPMPGPNQTKCNLCLGVM